jgi:hypothetical protein
VIFGFIITIMCYNVLKFSYKGVSNVARLPVPNSDEGAWGTILNDFLSIEHNSDGTLKKAPIIADAEAKATTAVQTVNGKTGPTVTLTPADLGISGGGVPDATTSAKGLVQLAGDLAGTAAAPTVPGLATKATDSAVVHLAGSETVTGVKNFTGGLQSAGQTVVATNDARLSDQRTPSDLSVTAPKLSVGPGINGQVLGYNAGNLAWTTPGAVPDAAVGVKGILSLNGDLAGTATAPTVPGLASKIAIVNQALNVKDYGAVGDGVADDTAAIQAALNAVTVGGRAVYLPAGRYKVTSTLTVTQDGTTIFGDGAGNRVGGTQFSTSTRIEAASSIAGSIILVQRAANDRPLQGVTLHDFTVDGGLFGTAVDGIIFRSNQGHIEHVHIWSCSGTGLRLLGYTSPVWDTYDTTVTNCMIGYNAAAGAILDTHSADTHWLHNIFLSNQDNFIVRGASPQVTGCHFYTPTRHDIWFDGGGSRAKFVNCKIEGAGDHMFLIDSTNGGYSDIQITGCGFSSLSSTALDNTYDYLQITGPAGIGVSRTTIIGNSFNLKGGSPVRARYAVNLATNAAQNTVIVGNSFGPNSHWGTGQFSDHSSTLLPAYVRSNFNVSDSTAVSAAPFLNVADFGATGNGSTDDTAAVQAALNAVPSGGAMVWFPAGNYKITSQLVVQIDNTTLRGVGAGSRAGGYPGIGSRITASGTFVSPVISIARPAADRAVYAPKLVDLAIDCSSVVTAAAGPVDGLLVTAVRGELSNVAVWNASGNGIRLVGISTAFQCTETRLISVVSSNNTGNGFHIDSFANDNTLVGCVAESNASRGIQLIGSRTLVSASDFLLNTLSAAYLADAGNSTRFNGCKFRLSANHGVEMSTSTAGISDVSFNGCLFDSNGTSTTNTYDHLFMNANVSFGLSRTSVTGCSFTSSQTNLPRYGVNLATSGVQNALIASNSFASAGQFGTASLVNNGSVALPVLIRSNINAVDYPAITASTTVQTTVQASSYTLALADGGTVVEMNAAAGVTVTVPTNATVAFPVGSIVELCQVGAGQVTIAAAAGVTLRTSSSLTTRAQWSTAALRKRATDEWVVVGDLT